MSSTTVITGITFADYLAYYTVYVIDILYKSL